MPTASKPPVAEPLPPSALLFFFTALAWGGTMYFIASQFAHSRLWFVVATVFLVSIPIALGGIYGATVRQIRRLEIFARRGWLFRLLSGRPLKVVVWVCWGLLSGFFMLVQFHAYSPLEWGAFFLVVPVFWGVFHVFRRLLADELRPYLLTSTALSWARWWSPLIMLALHTTLLLSLGDVPAHDSLQEAVAASRSATADMRGSALMAEISHALGFYEGVKAYALGRLGTQDTLGALLLAALGGFVVFFNACAMLSCFLIPHGEYRRIFGSLASTDIPEPLVPSRVGMMVAVTTFLALFIYLPVFAYLEAWAQQRPVSGSTAQALEARLVSRLEQIDDVYFREGTLAQLDQARMEALQQVEVSLAQLDGEVDRAFALLEDNVDVYLDWYYSLAGEYARIANLLVGNLETYMIRKLEESLHQGDAFAEVEASLNLALAEHGEAQAIYRQAAEAILARNRIEPRDEEPVEVVRRASLADVLSPPAHQDMINLQQRMLASGGAMAGVVSAVIIQKVVAKVVGKNTFKLAGKALAKMVAGKTLGSTTGAGAGAAAGAAIGSIVPGLGTVIGATIGGVVGGIAVGTTVDKVLIELEEVINREEFKRDILAAIEEARQEFRATLFF